MLSLESRFHALGDLLAAHAALWRPAPFHEPRPAWCARFPSLAIRLLALDDSEVERLAGDNRALIDLASRTFPGLSPLHRLIDLPRAAFAVSPAASADDARLAWRVPGRKQAEIEAFAAALPEIAAPILEWCAGKGHLGRLLAQRWQRPVLSLEWDAELCAAGAELAARAGVEQRFLAADVLSDAAALHLTGRHAVALHACGDLHLALLRGAAAAAAPALDLAPCCYYRIAAPGYRPLNPDAGLALSRDELHLAVTDIVSAGTRERRRRDRDTAWKLAFLELRAAAGSGRGQTFKPIPAAWYGDGFAAWMRHLALREGVPLAAAPDWDALERHGWARRREVRRLELLRLAFRRPLEIWLALDRALYLERRGYRVTLSEFCPRRVTPRNLLISARMADEASRHTPLSQRGAGGI
jgi:hypothetical protein